MGKIYLIDESGMLNRELLYEIARNITDNDIIYFLGDIKQLPPIGTGCPFYNLMCIMSCVELGVSKRAAEGSLINYNTTVINCLSDGVMEDIMSDDTSFIVRDCSNDLSPKMYWTYGEGSSQVKTRRVILIQKMIFK